MRQLVQVQPMSNRDFLAQHAAPGRIGLAGGTTLIDRAIQRAERHVDPDHKWGVWSHAFFFGERRADGHVWVIESDLQIHRKHYRFGVQENHISKYHDEVNYGALAILDLGLTPVQTEALVREALELLADHTRYSIRELFGTLLALRRPGLRPEENRLSRDRSLYCSAFVHHLFRKNGIDLAPGVHLKNTTPEDIARTALPHTAYVMDRGVGVSESIVKRAAQKVRDRVQKRVETVRKFTRRDSPSRG